MKQSKRRNPTIALLLVASVLLFLPIIASPAFAAANDNYVRVQNDKNLIPNENYTLSGTCVGSGTAANNVSIAYYVVNSTGHVVNSTNSTAYGGVFNTTIRAPGYEDNFTVKIWCPTTGTTNKSYAATTELTASVTGEFINTLPPFGPGDTITLKAVPKYANGSSIVGHVVRARIYESNGKNVSWGYAENMSNSQNFTLLTFTIPSSPSIGDYLVDLGPSILSFSIKNFSLSLLTESTSSYDSKNYFSTSENISIRVKVRDKNGTTVSGATVSVTVTFPNGTDAQTFSLTEGTTGVFNGTFTRTGGIQGAYSIKTATAVGSSLESTSGSFTVRGVRMSISESSLGGFFDNWGSKKVVSPGSNLALDLKAFDVATGMFIGGALSPSNTVKQMNCSAANLNSVTNVQTGLAVPTITIQSRAASQPFFGDTMCSITINTITTPGTFKISVNTTVNSSGTFVNETAVDFFTTQSFILSVEPVSKIGREEANAIVKPGKNTTFKLRARNVTSASTMGAGNISSVVVSSLTPMGEFVFGGAKAITNVSYSFDATTDRLTVFIPTDASGPTLVSVSATVGGQAVAGSGFVIAAYFMGFAGPQGGGMVDDTSKFGVMNADLEEKFGEAGGGPSGEFSGTFATCAANQNMNFFSFVMDAETGQQKSDVTLKMYKIREESSGQEVTHCFNTTGGITDSTGRALFNLSVVNSSCASGLSGFYFMLLDARWQNTTGQIPGGFECKQLNFFPFPTNWNLGSDSMVTLALGNVQHMTNKSRFMTNGTIQFTKMFNFDPEKGATPIDLSSSNFSAAFRWPTVGALSVNINLSPTLNFTTFNSQNAGKWFAGFYGGQVKLCDNRNTTSAADDVCDSSFFGWKITPFEAYSTDSSLYSASWSLNDTKSLTVFSKNNITFVNVSRQTFRGNENSKIIDLRCGDRTRGTPAINVTDATGAFSFCNQSAIPGGFSLIINFTVLSNLTADMGMFIFTLNNGSEKTTVDVFADLKGSLTTVVLPERYSPTDQRVSGTANASAYPFSFGPGSLISTNWTINMTNRDHDLLSWNLSDVKRIAGVHADRVFNMSGAELYCAFANPFNRSVQFLMVPNTTNGFDGSSNVLLYIKISNTNGNGANVTGPIRIYTNLTTTMSSNKHYLVEYRYCEPVFISSRQADYTAINQPNGWSTQWGFAGRFERNQVGSIPLFFGDASGNGKKGAVIDIDNIASMSFDRIGFGETAARSSYVSQQATTDDNGMAMVRMNFSAAGVFKLFWNATYAGQTDAADFQGAPVAESLAFQAYGQWANTNGFTQSLNTNTESANKNFTVTAVTQYFNGTALAGVNVTANYLQFTDFGPPTLKNFVATHSTTGAVLTNTTTDTSGTITFNITPTTGNSWPTGPFGKCVNVQGTANASGNYGTVQLFFGSLCTVPTNS